MATKAAALQAWLSGFGIPAFPATSVPDGQAMPYITYTPASGAFGDGEAGVPVSIWYRTRSEAEPNAKAEEVARALGLGGCLVPCDGGGMWVKRGSPFSYPVPDTDNEVKRRDINLSIEFITAF